MRDKNEALLTFAALAALAWSSALVPAVLGETLRAVREWLDERRRGGGP